MSDNKKSFHGASIFGLILVLLGLLWVLSNLDIIDFRFHKWWPLILIALGLINLVGYRKINNPTALILIALGAIFILATHNILEWHEIWKFWPFILIIIGFSILFGRKGKRIEKTVDVDEINGSAVFGSFERKITNKNFRGGSVAAVFGGAEVDLRLAEMGKDGAVIEAQAVFGGVTILIPESWPVETYASAIFGGIENSAVNKETKEGKRLIIKASATFGGVEIKN